MVMKRRSRRTVLLDIVLIDVGIFFLYRALSGYHSPMLLMNLLLAVNLIWLGYREMIRSLQTVEVDEIAITHQFSIGIIRVQWDDIKTYVLNEKRFVALDAYDQILLDLDLHAYGGDWPFGECERVRQHIERKMNEVGALQTSAMYLRQRRGVKIKP